MKKLFVVIAVVATVNLHALEIPEGRWTKLRLAHFTVYSNARDGATRSIVTSLQRIRETLAHVMGLEISSPIPTTVLIFADERNFAPFRDAILNREAKNIAGIYSNSVDAHFIAIQAAAPGGIDRIVYHELTHSVIERNASDLPLWYQEGIAEFYSTFAMVGDSVKIGMAPRYHLDHLAEWGLMPLSKVFAMNQDSAEYNESTRAGDFYATSWLFVHYLLVGAPNRSGQLGTFLTLVDAGKPVEKAFSTSFGTTFERFEGELRQYVHRPMRQMISYTPAQLNSRTIPPAQEISRGEVLYHMSDFLARVGRLAEARELLTHPDVARIPDAALLARARDLRDRISEGLRTK